MSNTADYYDHPVLNNQVFVNTPAIRELEEVVHQWIWHGIPGGMVLGDSRMGKSWAARSLEHNLYTRAKVNIPSNYISIGDRDQPTIATVFKVPDRGSVNPTPLGGRVGMVSLMPCRITSLVATRYGIASTTWSG